MNTPVRRKLEPQRLELEMNAGHFEQLSDCWSSEQQPATYYRTAAAQARRLQADPTTPKVKQNLDKMIDHCERLAGKVEPGLSPARSATIRPVRLPSLRHRRSMRRRNRRDLFRACQKP